MGGADADRPAGAPHLPRAPPPSHPPLSPCSSDDDLAAALEAELAGSGSGSPSADGSRGGGAGAGAGAAPGPAKRARLSNGDGDGAAAAAVAGGPSPICPPHPASMGGICVRCGAAVPVEEVEAGVALR